MSKQNLSLYLIDGVIKKSDKYAAYEEIERISLGRHKWKKKDIQAPSDRTLIEWLVSANDCIWKASTADLITMYAYTTQEYQTIISFMRGTQTWEDTVMEYSRPIDELEIAASLLQGTRMPINLFFKNHRQTPF